MEEIATVGIEVSVKESGGEMERSKEGVSSHGKREVCEKGTLTAFWGKKSKAVVDLVCGDDPADDGNDVVVVDETIDKKKDENLDTTLGGNEALGEEISPEKDGEQEEYKDGESGLRKRKRQSLPGEVVSVLEASFAKNAYPSAQEKKEIAAKCSIDVKKVTNWFERRRKKARAEGTLSEKKPMECSVLTENNHLTPVVEEGEVGAEKQNEDVEMEICADAIEALDGLLAKHGAFSGMSSTTLTDEAAQLREHGLLQPLEDLSILSGGSLAFSESMLCKLVAGQRATLTALVDTLHSVFCGENKPSKEALRTCIVDLAARKSYDFVNSSVPKHLSLEMENPELIGKGLWQWEIRDRETLPRSCRTQATAIKKRGMKIGERLKIISSLLDFDFVRKSTEEVTNVLTSLLKTSSLSELDAQLEVEQAASQNKDDKERLKAEREAEKMRKQKEKDLEKEKMKEMKLLQQKLREEEKAKAAEEKEAERQRLRAEKEEQKKRLKAEKEAEKEKKILEDKESKLCKKTGFKDPKVLHKTADKFKSFFQKADPVKEKTPAKAASTGQDNALSPFDRRFPKPPMENLSRKGPPKCLSMDENFRRSLSFDDVSEKWKISLQAAQAEMKSVKEERTRKYLGLPPSWAQKTNALEAAEERMEELKGSGIKANAVRTWRRKFIWFPADSKRPPYYGSWSVQSSHVTARNPLAQDQSMDYEVMSDIDWEEEPEGSSLSRGDSMSEIGNESVDEEDSFFVEDGYLSHDEGVQLDEEEDEELEKAIDAIHIPESPNESNSSSKTAYRSALAAILDKSKRSGKPFVLSRTGVSAEANHGACFHGDSNLVPELEMELLLPGGLFEIPKDPYEAQSGDMLTREQTAEDAMDIAKHAATVTKGSNADLLPILSSYILNNASLTKPVLVEGFLSENSDRKITKKWVNESISLLANRSGSKWVLKSKEDVLDKTPATKTPACTLKAPKSSEIIEKQNKPLLFAKTPVRNSIDLTGADTPPVRNASSVDSKFWQNLVEEIESDMLEPERVPYCTQAFSDHFLSRHIASFPSNVLAVLISNLVHRMGLPTGNQMEGQEVGMLLTWLSTIVSIMATTHTSSGPDSVLRSQTTYEPIAKPVVATIADVAHHQALICKLCHMTTLGEQKAFDILSNLILNSDSGVYLKSQANTARALDAVFSNVQNTLSKSSAWSTTQASWSSISQQNQ
eukprot:jgi/Picsp_1/5289/NSC_02651-R1_chromatin assembly factor subunit a